MIEQIQSEETEKRRKAIGNEHSYNILKELNNEQSDSQGRKALSEKIDASKTTVWRKTKLLDESGLAQSEIKINIEATGKIESYWRTDLGEDVVNYLEGGHTEEKRKAIEDNTSFNILSYLYENQGYSSKDDIGKELDEDPVQGYFSIDDIGRGLDEDYERILKHTEEFIDPFIESETVLKRTTDTTKEEEQYRLNEAGRKLVEFSEDKILGE